MRITTYEAIIENGQVRLTEDAYIPDNTKVYVIVPTGEFTSRVRLASPRLAHAEQAAAFAKDVKRSPQMLKYDGQRFSPAAPTGTVSITNPDTGSTLSGVSVLLDTGADISVLSISAA